MDNLQAVQDKVTEYSNSQIIYPGLQEFREGVDKIDPNKIPGLSKEPDEFPSFHVRFSEEAGWTIEMEKEYFL